MASHFLVAELMSVRVNMLMALATRMTDPLLRISTVISHFHQLWNALNNIRKVGEWIVAAEKVMVAEAQAVDPAPGTSISNSNGKNFKYNGNLD